MPKRLAFLHTSPIHVETFDRLVKQMDPAVEVQHFVAEELLADAQRLGADDPALIRRVQQSMADAAAGGAALVVCTCSTIGGAAERTPPAAGFGVARIDRAMADRAARQGPRILLVAALESTVRPTEELLQESAEALGTEVVVEPLLVEGAWSHFLHDDRGAYMETVAGAVRGAASRADVVVLAQASMAGAAELLQALPIEVLSSPRLGVEDALERLRHAR